MPSGSKLLPTTAPAPAAPANGQEICLCKAQLRWQGPSMPISGGGAEELCRRLRAKHLTPAVCLHGRWYLCEAHTVGCAPLAEPQAGRVCLWDEGWGAKGAGMMPARQPSGVPTTSPSTRALTSCL